MCVYVLESVVVFLCVYVCGCVCMHACMHVCMHVCTRMHACVFAPSALTFILKNGLIKP